MSEINKRQGYTTNQSGGQMQSDYAQEEEEEEYQFWRGVKAKVRSTGWKGVRDGGGS